MPKTTILMHKPSILSPPPDNLADNANLKSHKQLFSQHCDYNPALNKKLTLLYHGGFEIEKYASLFLTRLTGLESNQAYQQRLKSVSYIPYLSEYITQFGASLFSEELEIKTAADAEDSSQPGEEMTDDFYQHFIQSCDLNGRSAHQFLHDQFETAISQLKVYVGIDFPSSDLQPINRAQEKAMGLDKGYFYTIPYDVIVDWKQDPQTGQFLWIKMFEECCVNDDPLQIPRHYFQFKLWTIKNQQACWEIWQTAVMPMDRSFTLSTKYKLINQGNIPNLSMIPILDFVIPKSYHVGQQIGSICQEHYQRRSFMVSNANKTCVALGVVKLGPEVGGPGDAIPADLPPIETPQTLRKQLESDGWTVVRDVDDVKIVEAKGEAHKFVADELKHLVESMAQVLRQMNMTARANQGQSLGRSAQSKQIDQHGTSMVLSVYDRQVKDFTKRLFTLLSTWRKEDIDWVVEGLSTAQPSTERKDLISEISTLGVNIFQMPNMVLSKYLFRVSNELLDNNLSDVEKMDLQTKIAQEVQQGKFTFSPPNKEGNNEQNQINSKSLGNDMQTSNSSDQSMVSQDGHQVADPTEHLSTGEYIDPRTVYDSIKDDYDAEDMKWILQTVWKGPVLTPLSSIDMSNSDQWRASQPGPDGQDKVQEMSEKMADKGQWKPVILLNTPHNNEKLQVSDGRHRILSAQKLGIDVLAYIGETGSAAPETDAMKMHGKQKGSKS